MIKTGDRVKHKYFKWLKTTGTAIEIEADLPSPFLTANIPLPGRVRVRWDAWEKCEYEDYGLCEQRDLEVIS